MKPSESIRLAEASDWVELEHVVTRNPKLAQETDDYGMLPIHWASTECGVPVQLLECLISAYPDGSKTKNNANLLPLHIAVRAKAGVPWLLKLLESYPESIVVETPNGQSMVNLGEQAGIGKEQMILLIHAQDAYFASLNVDNNNNGKKLGIRSKTMSIDQSEQEELPTVRIARQCSAPQATLRRQLSMGHKSTNFFIRSQQNLQPTQSYREPPTIPPLSMDMLARHQSLPQFTNGHSALLDESSDEGTNNSIFDNVQHQPASGSLYEPAPEWKKDTACYICRSAFGMFRHRHHCRNCGKSICRDHSGGKVNMPAKGYTTPQRACVICFSTLKNRTKSVESNNVLHHTELSSVDSIPSPKRRTSLKPNLIRKPSLKDSSVPEDFSLTMPPMEEVQDLQYRIFTLEKQVEALSQNKMTLQHQLLEQEEVQAKTMLLLTETMTRVSVLELKAEDTD